MQTAPDLLEEGKLTSMVSDFRVSSSASTTLPSHPKRNRGILLGQPCLCSEVQNSQQRGGQRASSQNALFRLHLVVVTPQLFDHSRSAITLQNHPTYRRREIRGQRFLPETREKDHLVTLFLIKQDADRGDTKFTSHLRVQPSLEHRSGGRFACTTPKFR